MNFFVHEFASKKLKNNDGNDSVLKNLVVTDEKIQQ